MSLLTALSLLPLAAVAEGCTASDAPSRDPPTVREKIGEGIPVEFNAARAVPFVYCDRLPTLTADQSDLILRAAEENKPQGTDIWFVAVVFNVQIYDCRAFAYYSPEARSQRVRKGRYADICIMTEATVTPKGNVFGKEWGLTWNRKGEYVQVSPPDEPFAEGEAKPEVPAAKYIPFPRPLYPDEVLGDRKVEPMTDNELVALVDFARAHLGLNPEDVGEGVPEWNEPICSVVVGGGNRFAVAFGVSNRNGLYLHVKRRDDGRFTRTQFGMWAGSDATWWPEPERKTDAKQDENGR